MCLRSGIVGRDLYHAMRSRSPDRQTNGQESLETSHLNHPHSSLDRTWRVPDADDILWAQWDDDFIAFHRPSGRTHLLNAASEVLLTRILLESKTTTAIVRELTSDDHGALEDELVAEIHVLLIHLEELGLVVAS